VAPQGAVGVDPDQSGHPVTQAPGRLDHHITTHRVPDQLFAAGRSQAEVARQLGVARQNISRWHARWRHGGSPRTRRAHRNGIVGRAAAWTVSEG
jgi:hypothetical protein